MEQFLERFTHFDPLNLIVMLVLAIAAWVSMRNTIAWHTKWISKHDADCAEQRKANNQILTEIQKTNVHLATLTEGHERRLVRLEDASDRVR